MKDQTIENQQQKKKKSKQKYCKCCNKYTNHLTIQSKSCLHHDGWLQEQKYKKDKTKNKLTDNNKNNEEKNEEVSKVAHDSAVGGDGVVWWCLVGAGVFEHCQYS